MKKLFSVFLVFSMMFTGSIGLFFSESAIADVVKICKKKCKYINGVRYCKKKCKFIITGSPEWYEYQRTGYHTNTYKQFNNQNSQIKFRNTSNTQYYNQTGKTKVNTISETPSTTQGSQLNTNANANVNTNSTDTGVNPNTSNTNVPSNVGTPSNSNSNATSGT